MIDVLVKKYRHFHIYDTSNRFNRNKELTLNSKASPKQSKHPHIAVENSLYTARIAACYSLNRLYMVRSASLGEGCLPVQMYHHVLGAYLQLDNFNVTIFRSDRTWLVVCVYVCIHVVRAS